MRTIHVHGSAERDVIDIRRYSFEQWGELQADKYLDELDSGIRKLADNPEIGVKRDHVRDGYRVLCLRPFSDGSAAPWRSLRTAGADIGIGSARSHAFERAAHTREVSS